jgi:DNA-binding HxlR family transcriptional regulator
VDGDAYHANCQGREILDHVTSRWAVLILCALSRRPMRFFEIRDRTEGISEKMLSRTLRTLVRDGLAERTVTPLTPPQVSYSLTPLGTALSPPLRDLLAAIRDHAADIASAQQRYDQQPANT